MAFRYDPAQRIQERLYDNPAIGDDLKKAVRTTFDKISGSGLPPEAKEKALDSLRARVEEGVASFEVGNPSEKVADFIGQHTSKIETQYLTDSAFPLARVDAAPLAVPETTALARVEPVTALAVPETTALAIPERGLAVPKRGLGPALPEWEGKLVEPKQLTGTVDVAPVADMDILDGTFKIEGDSTWHGAGADELNKAAAAAIPVPEVSASALHDVADSAGDLS